MKLRRPRRPNKTVVSAVVVALFAAGIGVLAATNKGFATTDVELDDAGVWVTKSSEHLVGRLNHQAGSIDGALRTASTDFDVLQAGRFVVTRDAGDNSLALIDPAALAEKGKTVLPASAQVGLGADTVAIVDGVKGNVWVLPTGAIAGFAFDSASPAVKGLAGSRLAVTTGGNALVASAAKGSLTRIETDGQGVQLGVSTSDLERVGVKDELDVTAVGDEAVVLDRTANLLLLPDGKSVSVPGAKDVQLQQPGPGADAVIYATNKALVRQPLDGSKASELAAGAEGKAARPVFVAGCAYGAWSGSNTFVRDCAGSAHDSVQKVEGATGELSFRVNWGLVVLNDIANGGVWLTDDKLVKVDDWRQALPDKDQGDEDSDTPEETLKEQLPERTDVNHPPIAVDDSFGVRAGRVTILPVAANDTDPDGDVLTVSLAGPPPALGTVQSVQNGAALQISVPDGASGTASFRYTADDGRGGKAQASVSLKVVPADQNDNPKQTRQAVVRLAQGRSIDYNLLSDWIDPDGDPLYLAGASTTTDGDEVRFRADGTLSFQDAGKAAGRKQVTVLVSDGRATAEGTLYIDVRADGTLLPVVNPDHYTISVGDTLTARPLANDSDPQGGSLRLVKVDEQAGVEIEPDFNSGVFTFRTATPGTYYLSYAVANDVGSGVGLVRIDVTPKSDADLAPVAVADTAVLPAGGSVLAGVLSNDEDPKGGVLIVQSIDVASEAPVSVAILNHELLRISEVRAFDKPFEFSYTVSNGSLTAVGTVTVIPAPAPAQLQPPVALDDDATVRVGDIVTIPVLANDTHPDNAPLTLVPQLVETPDPGAGLIFTTKDTVRFQAANKPGTYTAVYQVTDGQNVDAAKVSIHVREADPEHNSPPVPQRLTARAIAGSSVRIPIPLDGIDPDGDYVYLVGQASPPSKGIVTEVGTSYLIYEAGAEASGTDAFTYSVRDRLGAVGTATIVIGIAQPSDLNRPPTPTDDLVKVRPGRTVAVPVLQNDTDPDGDTLNVDPKSPESADGIGVEVKSNRLVFTAPAEEGTYSISYRAQDPHGASASATVTVEVSNKVPLAAPIARDDEVPESDVAGKESVKVSVLDNDEDPDGSVSELTVTAGGGMSVNADGTITVPVTPALQILPYTITDQDGLAGKAFVIVPGTDDIVPVLNPSAKALQVKSGVPLPIDLGQQISVAPGKHVRIGDDKSVTGHHGTVTVDGEQKVTFTSDADYFGQAGVSLQVTDGASREDPAGHRAVLTIPIEVLAPDNRPPTFTSGQIEVAAGESQTVDLSRYATDPDPADKDKLTFALTGPVPAGFQASLSGAQLTISADATVAKGTSGEIKLSVKDPINPAVAGTIVVTAVGSTKPLPRAIDDAVEDARQGRTETVNVLANDFNPFPDKPLSIVAAAVESGDGRATVQGQAVAVTPGDSFVGTLVVRYRIADATGEEERQVEGRIRLNVKGKPGEPRGVQINEVADGRVVLAWSAGAANGSPITGYTVSGTGGYSRDCPATTCTLSGLKNGTQYTFTVVAHNDVGDSPPSSASAPATPDAVPDTPAPPRLSFGDRSLAVSWARPATRGTPVSRYDLRIVPAPPSGDDTKRGVTATSLTWSGLENGTSYQVQVKAYNDLPGGSDWSASSAAEVPAGKPPAPGKPSLELAPNGAQMVLTWSPPSDGNGDAPKSYVVYGTGGSGPMTIPVKGGQASSLAIDTPASTEDYTFQVSAVNKAGEGAKSTASNPVRYVGQLSAIKNAKAADGDGSATITFDAVTAPGARAGEIKYYYQVGSKGRVACGTSPTCKVTGLTNNSTYSVALTAELVNRDQTLTSSADVGNIKPYGPIKNPSMLNLSWKQQGIRGTFTWSTNTSVLRNGRDVSSVTVTIDGNGTANDGSQQVGNGPDQSHTLKIKACATDGSCAENSINGKTASRSIEIHHGAPVNDGIECRDNRCTSVDGSVSNFAPNKSIQVQCWNRSMSVPDWKNFSITTNGDGSASWSNKCWIMPGAYGGYVWVLADGLKSPEVKW